MNNRLNHVLVAPHLSEKGMDQKAFQNVHIFKVRSDANKIEIKKAVELHFGVKVLKVTTATVKPKQRRVGRNLGTRSGWKKAYVTVQPGSGEIEYFEGT